MKTPRNKNIVLIVGFIIVLLLSYRFVLSKTIFLKNEISKLEQHLVSSEDLAHIALQLDQREKFIDSVLQKNNLKHLSIQNNLLEFLNREAREGTFQITQFTEPHRSVENEVTTTSYRFTLRGSFLACEQIIYQLEQAYNFGKITHLKFEKKRDFRKGKDYLECNVIIESFVSLQRVRALD
ncbi:MAG: hypothetical protein AAFP76_00100 [Bacteroidota bacterium]